MFSEQGTVTFGYTGCVIRACMVPDAGVDDILFDSIDELLRWQGLGVAQLPAPPQRYRLFKRIVRDFNLEKGFTDYGDGVSVDYDGRVLTVTAPTPEMLVEKYNQLLRGE